MTSAFTYALTVALSHKQIKKDPERILKIKRFIDQYKKRFELTNKSITPNILYIPRNTEKIRHAYKSKSVQVLKIK